VILTGGDPFILSPRRLKEAVQALNGIDHLGVIRVHTRVPIVDPARIDAFLIDAMQAEKAVYVVVHCNHPRELSLPAVKAIRRIIDAGIPVLSQSVLLKGVNDDAPTLEALFRSLVRARVKPYYLHHPDRAPGTRHFRPSLKRGRSLVDNLRGDVSGLCQPTYVLDIPGGHGKVPVGIERALETENGDYRVRDPGGCVHDYQDELEDGQQFASD
jgi:lysine 2,3-aminomutase